MYDSRISLWTIGKRELELGGKQYLLEGEPKRGASCLVYPAKKREVVGGKTTEDRVFLKEFYPLLPWSLSAALIRQKDGNLYVSEDVLEHEEYQIALKRFEYAYETLLELRKNDELLELLPSPVGWFEEHGSYYRVESYDTGVSFAECHHWNLCFDFDIFMNYFSQCLTSVDKLHDAGYLHLDLKPQNLSLTKGDRIKLFDTDSFVKREDLEQAIDFAETVGYSAPELHIAVRYPEDAAELLGPWTDVYSMAQFVSWYIYGYPLQAEDLDEQLDNIEQVVQARFQNVVPVSGRGLFLLKHFLRKNLSDDFSVRAQNLTDLLMELREVQEYIHTVVGEPFDNFREYRSVPQNSREDVALLDEGMEEGYFSVVVLTSKDRERREELARYYVTYHRMDYGNVVDLHCSSFENLRKEIQEIPPVIEKWTKETFRREEDFDINLDRNWEIHHKGIYNPHQKPMLFLIFDEQEQDILNPVEEDEIRALLEVRNGRLLIVGKTDRCLRCIGGEEFDVEVNRVNLDRQDICVQAGRKDEHWLRNIFLYVIASVAGILVLHQLSEAMVRRWFIIDQGSGVLSQTVWWKTALLYFPNLLGCSVLAMLYVIICRDSLVLFWKNYRSMGLALWTTLATNMFPKDFFYWTQCVLVKERGRWYERQWSSQCDLLQKIAFILCMILVIVWIVALCMEFMYKYKIITITLTVLSWMQYGLSLALLILESREVLIVPILVVMVQLLFCLLLYLIEQYSETRE